MDWMRNGDSFIEFRLTSDRWWHKFTRLISQQIRFVSGVKSKYRLNSVLIFGFDPIKKRLKKQTYKTVYERVVHGRRKSAHLAVLLFVFPVYRHKLECKQRTTQTKMHIYCLLQQYLLLLLLFCPHSFVRPVGIQPRLRLYFLLFLFSHRMAFYLWVFFFGFWLILCCLK